MKPHQYWCIGRNFKDHASELGNPVPEKPLIFLKSGGCLQEGETLKFPPFCNEVHHELEVVLLLGEGLKPTHWTLGLDLTERRIQNELKQLGQPWELCKSFKGAAVLGPWQQLTSLRELDSLEFYLKLNGREVQHGRINEMIFNFERLIQYLSDRFPVVPGDGIFTGTPSGVGPLHSGDILEAVAGSLQIQWKIA